MKRHTHVALLATLMSATAWGQEVSVYGLTMAQMWKSETPGFDKTTYTPATQFLGIDATKLGSEKLSLHLFGWGQTDLGKVPSRFSDNESKNAGYLSYGYLQYQFNQANAELKAGRFTVNQSTGFEQVDGVSGRTDLINGFTVSAFAGKPVLFKTVDPVSQKDHDYQHDVIFGARLGWRAARFGELGLSYTQDGTDPAANLAHPSATEYTRRRLGADISVTPGMAFDLRGRTVFDVSNERSNVAEHDYTASFKLGSQVTLSGNYAQRDFKYYFAGTNLPSLFRVDENDLFKGHGVSLTWNTPFWGIQAVADYRHMNRLSYGETNRGGGELRWASSDRKVLVGASAHYTNAQVTLLVDATNPARSLSNGEVRAYGIVTKDKFTGSLDAIYQKFKASNPYMAGLKNAHEVIASLGYQATKNVKVSGDISNGSTPAAKNETRGSLRAEYRFGFGKKGGQ